MRRRILAVVMTAASLAWVAAAGTSPAEAGDWMFRRSYYTVTTARPGACWTMPPPAARPRANPGSGGLHPRFAIRGGWRFNSFVLQNGTNSTDRTFFRENWYDVNY